MYKHKRLDALCETISRFPGGVSVEELMPVLNPAVPKRTLQRWLASLIEDDRVVTFGKARRRRYYFRYGFILREDEDPPKNMGVPLSSEASAIQSVITQPLRLRYSVGYRRELLDNYKPNVTYYLPENLRYKLLDLGGVEEGPPYPAGTHAKEIFQRLLIDLSWNSSRLEGNTYSLLETERLLELGKAAIGKDLEEAKMILNHKSAIEFLVYSAEEIEVNRFTLLNLHALLSEDLMRNPKASGRLRASPVAISGSTYLPTAIPQLIQECFDLLIAKASSIQDPIEQAFFLIVHIPYLQAFEDVNKRTSRLAVNIPLIRNNLCPLSFIDVPAQIYVQGLLGLYELNRIELLRDVFVWAYERSCALYTRARKTVGEPDPFRMQYRAAVKHIVAEIVRKGLNKVEAISAIRKKASYTIPKADQHRFIERAEIELMSLHAGNIARFQLRPIEYENWTKGWF